MLILKKKNKKKKKKQHGAGSGQHGRNETRAWRNETRAWRRAMLKTPRPNTAMGTKHGCSRSRGPSNNRALHRQGPGLQLMLACRPYMQGTSEALTRVFKAHGLGTYHRPINTIRSMLVHPNLRTKHLTPRNVVWCTRWSALNAPSHTSVRQAGC